jgi:hypothetical protein
VRTSPDGSLTLEAQIDLLGTDLFGTYSTGRLVPL